MKTLILREIKIKPGITTTKIIENLHYWGKAWEVLEILDELKEDGKIE